MTKNCYIYSEYMTEPAQPSRSVFISQECPYLSQPFQISFGGSLLGCVVSPQNTVIIACREYMRFGYDNGGILKQYDLTGKLIKEYSLSDVLDISLYMVGVTMLKDSLIYQIYIEKIDYEDRQHLRLGLLSLDFQNHYSQKIVHYQRKIRYWAFSNTNQICYQQSHSSYYERYRVKLSYEDQATFGATFKGHSEVVGCYQLDSESKMAWITKDSNGSVVLYMLVYRQGMAKLLEPVQVSFNYSQHQTGHFWHPLWQLSQGQQKSTYLMAHQKLTQENKRSMELLNYCICHIENGKIIIQRILYVARAETKSKMYHQNVLVTQGNIFYLKYSESTQNSTMIIRQGFFDVSRSTFTYLPDTAKVYESQGAKGIIVMDRDFFMGKNTWEKPQVSEMIVGRAIFTGMAIKDAYMGLLLHLNSEFDDDLLADTMDLICQ